MLMYLSLSLPQCAFREKDKNCDGIIILHQIHGCSEASWDSFFFFCLFFFRFLFSLFLGSKGRGWVVCVLVCVCVRARSVCMRDTFSFQVYFNGQVFSFLTQSNGSDLEIACVSI